MQKVHCYGAVDATLLWIVGSGILMSAIALVGSVTLVLPEETLKRWLLPLVALAAGSMLGGALFHMLPTAAGAGGVEPYVWVALGFTSFFALEQFLHWHHCHRTPRDHRTPVSFLVLVADGVHNFIGGLGVASAFLVDVRLGAAAWIAAAAHEVPQELGDFGVLVHSGWPKRRALAFNVVSALTFPIGGVVAYAASFSLDVSFLLPFAAGNFLYIGAADLVPEINKHHRARTNLEHLAAFALGLGLLLAVRLAFE